MGDKREESRKAREDLNAALKEEFYKIHEKIMTLEPGLFEINGLLALVKVQISLAQHIKWEERALHGGAAGREKK